MIVELGPRKCEDEQGIQSKYRSHDAFDILKGSKRPLHPNVEIGRSCSDTEHHKSSSRTIKQENNPDKTEKLNQQVLSSTQEAVCFA